MARRLRLARRLGVGSRAISGRGIAWGGARRRIALAVLLQLRPLLSVRTVLRLWLPARMERLLLGDRLLLMCGTSIGVRRKGDRTSSRTISLCVVAAPNFRQRFRVPVATVGENSGGNGDSRFIDFG